MFILKITYVEVVVVVDELDVAAAVSSSEIATAITASAATATAIPATPSPANPAAADAAALPAAAPALAPAVPPAAPPALLEAPALEDCAQAACALNSIIAHKIEINFFISLTPGSIIKIRLFFYLNYKLCQ